jgi:hypothetical protein
MMKVNGLLWPGGGENASNLQDRFYVSMNKQLAKSTLMELSQNVQKDTEGNFLVMLRNHT